MRERLIELIRIASHELTSRCVGDCGDCADKIADHILADGWIRPPCKVGDTVWDTEGNAWKVFAITIWQDCIGLKTANNRDIRKTFTIGKNSIGKTVFLTKEEAENALKERERE